MKIKHAAVYIATMNVQVLRVISNDRFCRLVSWPWRHCCNKLTLVTSSLMWSFHIWKDTLTFC